MSHCNCRQHSEKKHHSSKSHHSSKPCPPSELCHRKTVDVERTVFVDSRFGSNTQGKLNSANCPYRTINGAISALSKKILTAVTQWNIVISPGNYPETLIVPVFVNLIGSGQNTTFIQALRLAGTSTVSKLTVRGTTFPLVATVINNDDPAQNQVVLQDVDIVGTSVPNTNGLPAISLKGSGLNNQVTLNNVSVNVNIASTNVEDQVLFDVTALVNLNNSSIFFLAHYAASVTVFNVTGKLVVDGGNFELRVDEGPAQEVNFYNVNTGTVLLSGNTSSILILQLSHPYLADVSYIQSNGAARAVVTNSTANLDGISVDFLNLVHSLNQFDNVQLLSLTTPELSAPRLKGFRQGIKYVVESGFGDVVASGGLYTNIVNVGTTGGTGNTDYFVRENDYTILSYEANVHLFDPSLANQQVLDTGKIIVIKNVGTTTINVDSQDNTIFDGSFTLDAFQSATLQNNGTLWYILTRG